VICLLLGAIILVVGLVQLAPGATTSDHKLALLISGSLLLLFGKNISKAFFH
jgi:membrane-bound ClpP family serine protease